MLHPHVPEDLKHFGKHLFATFLGLEQWREHHHEVKLAELPKRPRLKTPDLFFTCSDAKAEPATLSQAEMERMSYALRFQQSRQSQMLRLGREILKEIQGARRPGDSE